MAENLAALQVELDLNTNKFNRGIRSATTRMRDFERSAGRLGRATSTFNNNIQQAGSGFGTFVGAIAAAAGSINLFSTAIDKVGRREFFRQELDKTAEAAEKLVPRLLRVSQLREQLAKQGKTSPKLDKALSELQEQYNDLVGEQEKLSEKFQEAAVAVSPFTERIGLLGQRIKNIIPSLGKLGIAIRRLGIAVAGVAAGLAIAGTGLVGLSIAAERINDTFETTRASFIALAGSVEKGTDLFVRQRRVADELGVSFRDLDTLFRRFTIALSDIGGTNEDIEKLTSNILKLGRIGGSSTQEVTAATVQLSQGLASGALQGEELRSVLENLPLVADAIARGFNTTRGELRELGAQGELTAERVVEALSAIEGLDEQFKSLPRTTAQALQGVRNEFQRTKEVFAQIFDFGLFAAFLEKVRGALVAVNEELATFALFLKQLEIGFFETAIAAGEFFNTDTSGLTESLQKANREYDELLDRLRDILGISKEFTEAAGPIEIEIKGGVDEAQLRTDIESALTTVGIEVPLGFASPNSQQIAEFRKAIEQGVKFDLISDETAETFNRNLDALKGGYLDTLLEIENAAQDFKDAFVDSIIDGVAEGKLQFDDFAEFVLRRLAQIVLSNALDPLFTSIGNGLQGALGTVGNIGGGNTLSAGTLATGPGIGPAARTGSVQSVYAVGVPSAPYFGYRGTAGRRGASGGVVVNVFNQGNNNVRVEENEAGGRRELNLYIEQQVNRAIASGAVDRTMKLNYGLGRRAL